MKPAHKLAFLSNSCYENCGFCFGRVVRCHCETGISHSQNHFLNSESCSENTLELSESSDQEWPFHSERVFPEIGVVPQASEVMIHEHA